MFLEQVISSFTGSKFKFAFSIMDLIVDAGALRTHAIVEVPVQLSDAERDFQDSGPPLRPAASDCIIAARKGRGEGGRAMSCLTLCDSVSINENCKDDNHVLPIRQQIHRR